MEFIIEKIRTGVSTCLLGESVRYDGGHSRDRYVLEVINDFYNGLAPLIVPVTLFKHYVRKYEQSYLKDQFYLSPHPMELKLRNRV